MESADDFIVTANSNVNIVRWWFMVGTPPAHWVIRIYENQDCLPSNLLGTWNIDSAHVNKSYVCNFYDYPVYDCWASLTPSFTATSSTHYWISIQTDYGGNYWCFLGDEGTYQHCVAAYIEPGGGYDLFTPIINVTGIAGDFAFVHLKAALDIGQGFFQVVAYFRNHLAHRY